ncbi:hypothetical protein [Christiangramia sabulilitoris]|uniref:Uncharacterized protein n=1 Tax=Christiangramia sabulilitoris TaxID=2583991 RepID=A0A550I780_9FLAO|nr:hypothetical protein [Christiangramia sabulilitoris]TRO66811.1 hypothetical protein FGM01_02655 [Christiangramia sabulilitoris]
MKKYFIIIILIVSSNYLAGQESFKKVYDIPEVISYKSSPDICLTKLEKVKFEKLSKEEQDSIRKIFPIGSVIEYEIEKNISGKKVKIKETKTVNEEFLKSQIVEKEIQIKEGKELKGYVKFEDNKLYVNPYLKKDENGDYGKRNIYYYQLQNRQTIKLNFREWNVSGLTIPLKYRFKNDDQGISEEFSSDFNANLFIGKTFYGRTSFFHRKKVGNVSNTWKWTGGLILGASTVKLNSTNTSASNNPVESGIEITKGLASIGLGITYSYNKINFGGFVGWDYSLGDESDRWNYNKEPWVGVAIGYSLLKF